MGDETDMNYIREINAFYDWLETNELSTSAISLWYALMHINNKTGWKNDFTVALSVLSIKSGLSQRAVTNARKELTEKGRINWQSRNGNQAAQYTVNSLVGELQELYADNTSHNTSDNASNKVACNTSILVKPKHKQNDNLYKEENKSTDNSLFPDEVKKEGEQESIRIPYQEIVNLYHELCPSLSKIRTISDNRKKSIGARYKQYNFDIEVFKELFTKAEESDFLINLNGQNKDGWEANFDWLMNEANMAKVLEDKYENKAPVRKPQTYEHDESGRGAPVK